MALSNIPKVKTSSSSDLTVAVFDQYFKNPIELNNSELVAMTGFFESRGFQPVAAESTALTILTQAKKDRYSAMQIMDTLRGLGDTEISDLVAQILNYNRYKSSVIGVTQLSTPSSEVLRNIEGREEYGGTILANSNRSGYLNNVPEKTIVPTGPAPIADFYGTIIL